MKKLAFVLPVLLLAACSGARSPGSGPVRLGPGGVATGIDMATDARDVAYELKGSGLHFVARYYRSTASRLPALSADEARTVSSNGMKLVAVWQYLSNRPEHFSFSSGYADAMAAYSQAKAIGQPPGSAIYFAVDYNAPEHEIGSLVDPYFRGIVSGLAAAGGGAPDYRVGVYGSGAVCAYLKRARLVSYAWLSGSTAWAGYGSFADWNIRQGKRSPVLSFNNTANEARGDYGGFSVASRYSSL